MTRVLLVDDHRLVRSGLESLIGATDDLEVVGAASNGADAIEMATATTPDVVLMDLSMPVMDGVTATRRVLEAVPGTQVLVLTSFSDGERVIDAIEAGAVGYVLKDTEPAALLEAVRAVARGESPLDPRVARSVLAGRRARAAAGDLTEREREVLGLVVKGLANKQIGRALGISERTVKAHMTSVFQRIGVADRTSAALWAERNLRPRSG